MTSPGHKAEPDKYLPSPGNETTIRDPGAAQPSSQAQPQTRGRPQSQPPKRAKSQLSGRAKAWLRKLWAWRQWAIWALCAVLLAVAVRVEGRMVVDSLHSFAHLGRHALVWTIWAVIAETASMIALGLMERRILSMGGLDLAVGRAVAIAYASNALSASLPIIGSGAATTYSYRRLVSQGATTALATWALILSGVVSNIVFALIISIGGVVSGNLAGIVAGALGIVLTFLVVGLAVFAIRRPPIRERLIRAAVWTLERGHRVMRRSKANAAEIVADALAGLGALGANRQDIMHAATSALRNWGLDLICLVFCLRAAGVHVPWWGIILAWAAGSGGAALTLTPGGLGVVEVALTGALVALGVPGSRALAAVLIYRGITFWLAAAIGWLIYWRLRRDQLISADQSAEP